MLNQVNTALLEIQGALLARSLYPPGHPRISSSEERAWELLDDLLDRKNSITLFAVDNRIIFENEILPGSPNLSDTLFRVLQLKGVDQLTFRHGVAQDEIHRFLDALNQTGGAEDLKASKHLSFGSLRGIDYDPSVARVDTSRHAYSDQALKELPELWSELDESKSFDQGRLGDIVSSLSRVVSDSEGALLPLAPLKQHDEYTFVHTINVAMLSTALGEVLGFDSRDAHDLSISALLHDVGKQSIPHEILNKEGRFTDEEFRVMQNHTIEGARILLNTPNVPDIAPIVAFEHHVRADGSGYPRVPRGWKLSLASRVVQLADVFDALRTDRPYRKGQPVPKIIEIMRHDVGTFFDADLLHIFLRHVVARGVSTMPSHVDDDNSRDVDDDRPMNAKERWALKEREQRRHRSER